MRSRYIRRCEGRDRASADPHIWGARLSGGSTLLREIAVSTTDRGLLASSSDAPLAPAETSAERPNGEPTGQRLLTDAIQVGPGFVGLRLKRSFDLTLTGILLVASAPLSALIAVVIKRTSAGPILFRQVRVGRNGKHFEILKFRTMVHDADAKKAELTQNSDADGLFKIKDDPRRTRIGSFLRRSYLDELPQLINVMRGEMSLVGPRPLIVDEDAAIKGSGRQRLAVPPGMTGEWQLLGGGASLDEMIAVDYRYVAEWSLWRDLRCLVKTGFYVLVARKGW
jgi:lipopolysaccharide/colanic/teichoic acid biosynthesis glycosyltransferase